MKKQRVIINEDKCIGCGLCVNTCMQDVIEIKDGKAKKKSEGICDGIGNCLPVCPTSAITIEKLEVSEKLESECPGTSVKSFNNEETKTYENNIVIDSQLKQWPIQLKLVPQAASFLKNADILVAADCAPFAYGNFHKDFIQNKVVLIGCPKLDMIDYTNSLLEIFKINNINTVTVARMEVPCCAGIETAVRQAIKLSGKKIEMKLAIISTEGKIKSNV